MRAADEIGMPLCMTVSVVEPEPFDRVLAHEKVHTGKNLGVWPSPSGEALPGGKVLTNYWLDDATEVNCLTYNGTDWEDDLSSGPHGELAASLRAAIVCVVLFRHCVQRTPYADREQSNQRGLHLTVGTGWFVGLRPFACSGFMPPLPARRTSSHLSVRSAVTYFSLTLSCSSHAGSSGTADPPKRQTKVGCCVD